MFPSRAIIAGILLVGCSGASSPEIPAMTDTQVTEPPVGTPSPGVTTGNGSVADPGLAPEDHPPPDPGGPPDPKPEDPPKSQDPPKQDPPKPSCVVEAEGNNTWERATPFSSCVAGKVAGSSDTDYLRIVAPAKARKMLIEHNETGRIWYRVFREKGQWPLNQEADFTNDAPEISVNPGEAYLFRLSFPLAGNGNGERGYELKVSFK